MRKDSLKQKFLQAVLSRVLFAYVWIFRKLRWMPRISSGVPDGIQRIFFSFPYHSVGDLILSLTLLDRVHDRWPEAEIDVAVGSTMGAIVSAIPYVHTVFQLPRLNIRFKKILQFAEIRSLILFFGREIGGISYDLSISPRWDSTDSLYSGFLGYLTGAPIRLGYSGSSDGGAAEVDRFYTVAAVGGAHEHESLRYMRLLSRCGFELGESIDATMSTRPIRALRLIAEARKAKQDILQPLVSGRYAVLSPGATNARRMWPIARYAEVGRALREQHDFSILIIGSFADTALCGELSERIGGNAVSMAGKTGSLQMLDLIGDAEIFVGNDSGPAHIAGGLGVRTVVVSPFPRSCGVDHPNSPQRFRPAGPFVKVLQPDTPLQGCFPTCLRDVQHCILQISSTQVLTAIESSFEIDRQR